MVSSRERKKERLVAAFITLACLAGATGAGYLFWLDYSASGAAGLGKPLAKVERREQRVRRKPSTSYVWSNVERNEDLYRKDSVQTGEGSAAIIALNDGSRIELGENSLVVIDELSNLSLNFGNLVVRKSDGSDAKISVDRATGRRDIQELPVRVLKPANLSRFFAVPGGRKTVEFTWEVTRSARESLMPGKNAAPAALQISPDRAFRAARSGGATRMFPVSAEKALAELPTGRYFWRLVDSAGQPLTEATQLRIVPAASLNPVWPNAKQGVVSWSDPSEGTPVAFRWVVPKAAEDLMSARHELQLATDAGFTKLVKREEISPANGMATLPGLAAGRYFWRIVSQYSELATASPVERFALEEGKRLAIELVSPQDGASTEKLPQQRFAWSADAPDAVEYRWELRDSSGKTRAEPTRASAFVWREPGAGAYQWRVVAALGGQVVGESPWRAFAVYEGKALALRAPARGEEIRYWDKPREFRFEWEKDALVDEGTAQYRLEVASDSEFRKVHVVTAPSNANEIESARLKLPEGTLFWRVRVVDPQSRTLKTSETRRLAYGVHPRMRAPASDGAKPETGSVLDLTTFEGHPTASWGGLDGADAYEVTVQRARAPAGASPVLRQVTEKTTLELPNLEEGEYVWTVRAIDRLKRPGDAMPAKPFRVSFGAPLAAPEVTSKEVQ